MAMMKTSNQPKIVTMDLSKVPSTDPLAFQQGYLWGFTLTEQSKYEESDVSEKAVAFKEGYAIGKAVKLGNAEKPAWVTSA